MRAPMFSPQRESESDLGGSKSEMGHRNFCGLPPIPIRATGFLFLYYYFFLFFFCVEEKAKTLGKGSKDRERII
jgi:hypothetical protein